MEGSEEQVAIVSSKQFSLLGEFSVLCYLGGEVDYLVHDGRGYLVVLAVVQLSLLCLVLSVEHQVVSLASPPFLLCLLVQLLSDTGTIVYTHVCVNMCALILKPTSFLFSAS